MNRCAIVATHHKTGTGWMAQTFTAICKDLDIPLAEVKSEKANRPNDLTPPLVLLAPGSDFSGKEWLLENPEYRILHLIRDPRDVIISGMHYHRVATESQLHIPREKFGGLTYQQKLNSLETDKERYLFEMDNIAKYTASMMHNWNYGKAQVFECKYEDLIADTEMSLFTKIAEHLGFAEEELEQCREKFWRFSIFGGKNKLVGKTTKVRSGNARQWPTVFDRELGEAFLAQFGDVLSGLGYEKDNSWLEQLPLKTDTSPRDNLALLEATPKSDAPGKTERQNAAITYATVGERLEIYRLNKAEGQPFSFGRLGVVNLFTGEEYKPFLNSLSSKEKLEVEDCRKRAFAEYREIHAVNPSRLASNMLELAGTLEMGIAKLSPDEHARISLALQKLRQAIKTKAGDGERAEKAHPAVKPTR